ncbi:MAG TPA: hypothetical protein VGL16_01170 [Actinomycetota bacterium]|jgi:hypothetical protein
MPLSKIWLTASHLVAEPKLLRDAVLRIVERLQFQRAIGMEA